ncbi:unnamed protein product, partial [marine sediment metagenome]
MGAFSFIEDAVKTVTGFDAASDVFDVAKENLIDPFTGKTAR